MEQPTNTTGAQTEASLTLQQSLDLNLAELIHPPRLDAPTTQHNALQLQLIPLDKLQVTQWEEKEWTAVIEQFNTTYETKLNDIACFDHKAAHAVEQSTVVTNLGQLQHRTDSSIVPVL